jgi:hypothetical protein
MVRVIKEDTEKKEKPKSRLCFDGSQQKKLSTYNKAEMSTPTPSKIVIRFILILAVIFELVIASFDIKAAFLQGVRLPYTAYLKLRKDDFLWQSLPESWRGWNRVFRIVKCIYGMCEAPLLYLTKFFEVVNSSGLATQSKLDKCFFYAHDQKTKKFDGACCAYVDDGLHHKTPTMLRLVQALEKVFTFGTKCESDFDHLGLHLHQSADLKKITATAPNYDIKPVTLEPSAEGGKRLIADKATPAEYSQYRNSLGRGSWISVIEPKMTAPASLLASPVNDLKVGDCRKFNEALSKNYSGKPKMEFRHMAPGDLALVGCTDSSLSNVDTTATQFGGLIGITTLSGMLGRARCFLNLLDFWSRRQRRVVRSTFSGELYGLSYLLDHMVYVLALTGGILAYKKRAVFCDAASVVTCIHAKNPQATEKRTLVEIALIREILERYNIELHHIAGEFNPADVFTKIEHNDMDVNYLDISKTTFGTDDKFVVSERNLKQKEKKEETLKK